MRVLTISIASILSLGLQAGVDLSLQEPKKFVDIRDHNLSVARSAEQFQGEMKEYLEKHKLLQNHNLKINFNDVDLAGEVRYQMSAQNQNIRVLRDTARVRLEFSYELKDVSGNVVASGQENLKELYTLSSIEHRRSDRENYYFEKKLLDEWLTKTLKSR